LLSPAEDGDRNVGRPEWPQQWLCDNPAYNREGCQNKAYAATQQNTVSRGHELLQASHLERNVVAATLVANCCAFWG
jgi:hypothetical protein